MTNEELTILAAKVSEGEANMAELALYNAACEAFQAEEISWPGMETDLVVMEKKSLAQIWAEHPGKAERSIQLWPRIAAVAAAVAMIVFGVWFFSAPRHSDAGQNPGLAMNDIAPGKNGATITLANGKVIQLSDAKSGVVIGENKLAYNDGSAVGSLSASGGETPEGQRGGSAVAKTAKGQTYIFTLPDGTKVWLNAASTLTIPSDFSGTESRKVELTGEAYFEVAKNKKRPFIVATTGGSGVPGQEVKVLGTHFNISAYADEGSIKTTLLEGSVKIASLSSRANAKDLNNVVLKPGQQSVLTDNNRIAVANVDVGEAVAWKDGYFRFYEVDLETFMSTIARWYDIEVEYQGGISQYKDLAFGGAVSRSKKISEVLKILAQTGKVSYKIEGKKVTITK